MDNFAIRHLYIQQRHKVEDRLIRVNDKFVPDPASVNLTWKFYSKYKDTCDSCKNKISSANSNNASTEQYGNGEEFNSNQVINISPGCCYCYNSQTAQSNQNTAADKLSEYSKLVESTMLKTPQTQYKDWIEPPLTSMDYGWLPGDMFTAHYDAADRKRFFRGRRKGNFS